MFTYLNNDKYKIYIKCNQCDKILEIVDVFFKNKTENSIQYKHGDFKCSCGNIAKNNPIFYKNNFMETEPICCPKCGSTSVQLMKRGWKITSGFIGSNKNERVCMNCLHKW